MKTTWKVFLPIPFIMVICVLFVPLANVLGQSNSTSGQAEQKLVGDFTLSAPSDLKVSYIVFLLPISFDNSSPTPYTALVLLYEPRTLPWQAKFSGENVVAHLSDSRVVKGSHFAFGGGWEVGMTPPGGRTFMRVNLSSPAAMVVDGKEVSITPTYAVSLSGPIDAKFEETGKAAWFLFTVEDPVLISEMTAGDVKLSRTSSKK